MTTAAALTIGVALVTLVTVVAAGLKDTTRGALEHRIGASHVVTGADGWSPTEPAVERALAQAPADVTGIRQDRGLAFGDKETVNAIDPATSAGCCRFDWVEGDDARAGARSAPTARSSTRAGRPSTASASATAFALTSANGTKLDLTVRGIEGSPMLDAMGLGPVTIGRARLRQGVRERAQPAPCSSRRRRSRRRALAALPDAKVQHDGRVRRRAGRRRSTSCWRSSTCCSRSR